MGIIRAGFFSGFRANQSVTTLGTFLFLKQQKEELSISLRILVHFPNAFVCILYFSVRVIPNFSHPLKFTKEGEK